MPVWTMRNWYLLGNSDTGTTLKSRVPGAYLAEKFYVLNGDYILKIPLLYTINRVTNQSMHNCILSNNAKSLFLFIW